MTKEQAEFLYSIADNMGTEGIEYFSWKDGEKMREIIKALEQQPSDDGYNGAIKDISELLAYADEKFIRKCYPNESTRNLFDLNAKYGLAELLKTWTVYKTAMNEPTVECGVTTEEIAQSFIEDIEAVKAAKEHILGCNQMVFPATFEEYAKDYGFTDDKEIYTNGIHLIPVFRVQQWLEHLDLINCNNCSERRELHTRVKQWADAYKRGVEDGKRKALEQPTSDDCVSIAELEKWLDLNFSFGGACRKLELFDRLEKELPRVTPTFPKGATNGDMIKAMFPSVEVKEKNNGYEVYLGIGTATQYFNHQWWNAPYKRGSENG